MVLTSTSCRAFEPSASSNLARSRFTCITQAALTGSPLTRPVHAFWCFQCSACASLITVSRSIAWEKGRSQGLGF